MTDNNELAEALAEIAVLRRRWSDSESKLAACDSDLRTILAERDALRVDARRLDWLDSQRGDDVQCDRNGDPELVAHYWSVYDQCYDVRTAIDAAMAAEGRE